MPGISVCNEDPSAAHRPDSPNHRPDRTADTPPEHNDNHDEINADYNNDDNNNNDTTLSTRRQPPNLNTANLQTNIPYGSDMILPKPPNTTRLVDLNINGLRRVDDYQDVLEIGQATKMHAVDMLAFQETNIDWRSHAKSKTYERLQKVYHHIRMSTSSSTTKYNTPYQPGGTMVAVTDDYVGRVTEIGSDREMGRWSYIRLLGKRGRNIVIASVYNVCLHHGTRIGDRTAHAQQVGILRKHGRDESPRKAFLVDFEKQVEEWIAKDYEILINGDLNELLGAEDQSFARISAKHDLTEIIQHFHGTQNEPPTYARGRKRLDYIFCTPGILSSVVQCGILPYSDIIDSDHRSLFVDFDTAKLFGGDPAELAPNPVRILHSRDAKGCDQYVKAVYKYLVDHRVPARLAALSESISPNMEECERIDNDITRAMAHGMKKIRKLYTSPFSPQVKQARLRRRFYKLHLSMLRNRLDLAKQLDSLAEVLDEELPAPENVEQAQQLLRAAQKHVRKVNKQASDLRTTHLEDQISQLKDDDEGKAALIRERIIKAEAVKTMYKKLRSYLKPTEHNRICHIQVPGDGLPPKQSKQWTDIHEPVEIEEKLLERNEIHFGQADGPFTTGNLGTIPLDGSGRLAENIIRGNPTAMIDEVTQTFLEALQRPATTAPIPNDITTDEVIGKFKNWKESTSTSPFTKRHLGHYHCLLRLMGQEQPDKEPDEAIAQAKTIFHAQYSILSHAVKHGRSIKRWQKVANSMIEKEPGNPKIHRLRVIHLYEADYNLLLSIFWARKLVHSAEDSGAFNKNCYGGRPGMSAIEPVFLEELQVSLSYLSRTNQVVFHNDATSCYDRIIIALANLIARRFGMSQEVCSVHGETLAKMKYYISTALGISEGSYCHTTMTPIHGTGQGSCASPSVWLQICSLLFDCHERLSTGAEFFSPDRQTVVANSMTGYVDDTKGITNDMNQTHPIPVDELVAVMQADAQMWGDLLYTSGGALEIPKCNFYVMHWEFDEAGQPQLDAAINTTI
jgi:exonuclease III